MLVLVRMALVATKAGAFYLSCSSVHAVRLASRAQTHFYPLVLVCLRAVDIYAPKPLPVGMEAIIKAVIEGDIGTVKTLWRPQLRQQAAAFGREDTCHPLLHAAHRLHVEAVKFFLEQGLNQRLRGTVHPYTGDCMTVRELQGACRRTRGQRARRRLLPRFRRPCLTASAHPHPHPHLLQASPPLSLPTRCC